MVHALNIIFVVVKPLLAYIHCAPHFVTTCFHHPIARTKPSSQPSWPTAPASNTNSSSMNTGHLNSEIPTLVRNPIPLSHYNSLNFGTQNPPKILHLQTETLITSKLENRSPSPVGCALCHAPAIPLRGGLLVQEYQSRTCCGLSENIR